MLVRSEPRNSPNGLETDLRTSGYALAWVPEQLLEVEGVFGVPSENGVFVKPFGAANAYADEVEVTRPVA